MDAVLQRDLLTRRWRKVRAREPSESQIQIALVARLRLLARPDCVWFHVPNGGLRNKREAARFRAMGVLPGVPDLVFIMPGPRVLFLELKRRRGKPSAEQAALAERLRALGCAWECADGVDEAVKLIERFGIWS